MLYSGGVMQDLNNLIAPVSGMRLWIAKGINDNGQITGTCYGGGILVSSSRPRHSQRSGQRVARLVSVQCWSAPLARRTQSLRITAHSRFFFGSFSSRHGKVRFRDDRCIRPARFFAWSASQPILPILTLPRINPSQNMTVTSDIGNSTITLTGTGVAPMQSVNATAANAGLVRTGTTKAASFTVHNIGDGNLGGNGKQFERHGIGRLGTILRFRRQHQLDGQRHADLQLRLRAGRPYFGLGKHSPSSSATAAQTGANLPQTVDVELTGQGVRRHSKAALRRGQRFRMVLPRSGFRSP